MTILVCGGCGFIGSAFIRNYLKNNPNNKIINLDSLTIGSNKDNLKETVDWHQNNPQWWEPLANEKTLHPQPWTLDW